MPEHPDIERLLAEGVIQQMGWPWPYLVDVSKLNHRLFALTSEVEEAQQFDTSGGDR